MFAARIVKDGSDPVECVANLLDCYNVDMTLTGSPNPLSVGRTGSMQAITNTVSNLLNENYRCSY